MQIGTQKNLTDRLNENIEEERQKVEKLFNENLQVLRINLQESSTRELNIIEDAIRIRAEEAKQSLDIHCLNLNKAYGSAGW